MRQGYGVEIFRAATGDLSELVALRREAAAWLKAEGTDQWGQDWPDEATMIRGFAATIDDGTAWLVTDDDGVLATLTLDQSTAPNLWTRAEEAEPAYFVHRLTVARRAAGQGFGAELLDWCGNHAHGAGARWIRVDAWTTNLALHRYYLAQGFQHVRTASRPDYPSAALFQRRALAAATPRLTEGSRKLVDLVWDGAHAVDRGSSSRGGRPRPRRR